MDRDIRDLLLDDDLFDPFQDDEEETSEQDVVLELADEDTGIASPLEEREEVEKPLAPPEVRIKKLFEEAPGQKRLLLRLIDFCREPKTGEEMDAYTLDLQENCFSVYSPVILRELLEEAGAIEYIEDEEDDTVDELASDSSDIIDGSSAGLSAESKSDLASQEAQYATKEDSEPINPFMQGSVFSDINDEDIHHEILMEDGEEIVLDYLEVEERKPGVWLATDAGCSAVDAMDDIAGTKQLLNKEPKYLNIYHEILEYCAREAHGRSAKEIDKLVNDSPLLQEPRRYSGYFVSRLERQGALEWIGGWCITPAGKEVMADFENQVDTEASHV